MSRKESLPAINLIQKQGMGQSKVAFNLCTDNRLERRDSYFQCSGGKVQVRIVSAMKQYYYVVHNCN